MPDAFGDDWCYLLTASCGHDYCGGDAICTEAASNVTVDISAVADTMATGTCAADVKAHWGATITAAGGFGSPFNGDIAFTHEGLWTFDQTFGLNELKVRVFIGCVLAEEGLRLAMLVEVTIICTGGGVLDTAHYVEHFPTTFPLNCHGAYTIPHESSDFNVLSWPATITFQLPP